MYHSMLHFYSISVGNFFISMVARYFLCNVCCFTMCR